MTCYSWGIRESRLLFLLCVAASLTLFELVFLPPHLYNKEVRGEGSLYIVLFNTNVWLGLIVRYLLSIHNILLVFEIVLSVLEPGCWWLFQQVVSRALFEGFWLLGLISRGSFVRVCFFVIEEDGSVFGFLAIDKWMNVSCWSFFWKEHKVHYVWATRFLITKGSNSNKEAG